MIRRSAMLLSIAFILILSACSGGNGKQADSTSSNGTAASGIKPEDELVISATNYSFDQEEYHLKKACRWRSPLRMKAAITEFLFLSWSFN